MSSRRAATENIQSGKVSQLSDLELFSRLDTLVPGDMSPEGLPFALNTDLYCERLSFSGLEEMHRYSVDERLYRYLEFKPFKTLDDTRAYIEKLMQRMGAEVLGRTSMYWFVRRKSDRRMIGSASLVDLNVQRQSVSWGYGVDPELWGTGYILQLQEMLKHYVFEVLKLHRLWGITLIENQPTISSVLAAGMKHEGTLRHFYCKDGDYHDGWMYAMLAEDYFEQKPASQTSASYTMGDVIRIVASVLVGENIDESSTMENVLRWDSLNHMVVMVAVSEKTGIKLSPAEIAGARSVKAIHSIITGKR